MEIWFVVLPLWLLVPVPAAVVIAVALLVRHRERWATCEAADAAGAWPYREAPLARIGSRRIPGSIVVASIGAWVLGVVTIVVGVPAGLLLLLAASLAQLSDLPRWLAIIVVLVVICSGISLGGWLLIAGTRLIRRTQHAAATAAKVSTFCIAHHFALWIALSGISLLESSSRDSREFAIALLIPCGLGVLVGLALKRASRVMTVSP